MQSDQTGTGFISQVSSVSNLLIGVLFDFDNDELGMLSPYDEKLSTKGVVFINGYLSAAGYSFSSPDHFDVNDILPCQVPLLDEIADVLGYEVAFYNIDASLPQQFWSFAYDAFTAPGLPNYIANVPPSPVDPTFSNRTRSLILTMQNPVRPHENGPDRYLQLGRFGQFAPTERHYRGDLPQQEGRPRHRLDRQRPARPMSCRFIGLPAKYDFYIFSRDHYATLEDCAFELIDEGYAMCLVDDGTGTGTKIAQYSIDADGNYNELYTYVLYSPTGGVIESAAFTLKVTLGSPANLAATPPIPETPNSVNPQDLVGTDQQGLEPHLCRLRAVEPRAAGGLHPDSGRGRRGAGRADHRALRASTAIPSTSWAPATSRSRFRRSIPAAWPTQIAGSTTTVPQKAGKAVPFYGSLSHGLDKQVPVKTLQSADLTSFIPRTTVPPGPAQGVFGGNGLGSLIGTQFSRAFQGSGAIPPAIASDPTPGTTMKADDGIFYTFNAVTNTRHGLDRQERHRRRHAIFHRRRPIRPIRSMA